MATIKTTVPRLLGIVTGLFVWVMCCTGAYAAIPGAEPANFVPTHPIFGMADYVAIIKSDRTLYLIKNNQIMAKYPIDLGYEPIGPKHRRGDFKTPEGIYTIDRHNAHSQFYRALHISYPNKKDRAYARRHGVLPGGSIEIHGQPTYDNIPRTGDWTHGCIAVSDHAIDQIWAHVADGTPILIYP